MSLIGPVEGDSIESAGGVSAMRHPEQTGKDALRDGARDGGEVTMWRPSSAGGRPRRRGRSLVLSFLAGGVARATMEEELCYRQPNTPR
jgi:hypothetical protein